MKVQIAKQNLNQKKNPDGHHMVWNPPILTGWGWKISDLALLGDGKFPK